MDLPSWIIPPSLAVPALLAFTVLLGVAAWGAAQDPALRVHRYPALLVSVLVLWQMRAVTTDGLALHLLGAALLQLVFGWRLALLGLAAVIGGHTANGAGGWLGFGCNGLLLGALPVALSHVLCRTVTRRAPGNPFAYILIAGFAGGGLSMVAVLASTTALVLAAGGAASDQVMDQYAASGILLVFPEAFVTGTIVAWLTMFYPSWMATWTPPWEHAGGG